mmetsp:Transcript_33751/g.61157  ORF Transcript_33751/g.61157 Transcript_33751/m.61157 type:complete len:156 (-) Transcript_33751:129-596(-)
MGNLCAADVPNDPAEGTYSFQNLTNTVFLNVNGGNKEKGASVILWMEADENSFWTLRCVKPGVYTIQNEKTGTYLHLNVKGGDEVKKGAKVVMWDTTDVEQAQWKITPIKESSAYNVESCKAPGLFLNFLGSAVGVGVWDNPDHTDTQWKLDLKK